ncbi:MAG: TraR/DksA family transcriptional regulator [Pseudomonadota bacterium]
MQKHAIDALKARLLSELDDLNQGDAAGHDNQSTVVLDQQSVGRLSRMDALQRQALAQATQRRRNARRTRINGALSRMKADEFGFCEECGDDIAEARLRLDPTVTLCVECARTR